MTRPAPLEDARTPTFTGRTLPAPWAECSMCEETAAVYVPGDRFPLCPACTALELLSRAAAESLAALLAPHLGAWGNHWAAVGVPPGELAEVLERHVGGDLNADAAQAHVRAQLAEAMQEHPTPTFTPAQPDRVTLDPHTLPIITRARLDLTRKAPEGVGHDHRLSFTVREPDGTLGERQALAPGRDVLLILSAESAGEALLYYTGIHGQTEPHGPRTGPRGYRVPAELLPQVKAALGYFTPEAAQ